MPDYTYPGMGPLSYQGPYMPPRRFDPRRLYGSLGSPTNLQFPPVSYDPSWASGEIDVGEGLLGPWSQGRQEYFGGMQYGTQPPVAYTPPHSLQLGGGGGGGLPPVDIAPQAGGADIASYGLGRTPTNVSGVPYSPPHSLQLGQGIGYQPGGDTGAGAGAPEDTYGEGYAGYIKYLGDQVGPRGGIVQMESGVAGHEGEPFNMKVRKDAYGNVISFTPISSSPISSHWSGASGGKKGGRFLQPYRDWNEQSRTVNRNKYATPDWVKSMSNWRGI